MFEIYFCIVHSLPRNCCAEEAKPLKLIFTFSLLTNLRNGTYNTNWVRNARIADTTTKDDKPCNCSNLLRNDSRFETWNVLSSIVFFSLLRHCDVREPVSCKDLCSTRIKILENWLILHSAQGMALHNRSSSKKKSNSYVVMQGLHREIQVGLDITTRSVPTT